MIKNNLDRFFAIAVTFILALVCLYYSLESNAQAASLGVATGDTAKTKLYLVILIVAAVCLIAAGIVYIIRLKKDSNDDK